MLSESLMKLSSTEAGTQHVIITTWVGNLMVKSGNRNIVDRTDST